MILTQNKGFPLRLKIQKLLPCCSAQGKSFVQVQNHQQRLKEQLEAIREERILTLEAEIKSVEAQNLLNAGKREEVGLWDSIVLSTFQALGQFDLYAQKQAEILANKIEENNADQERLNNLRKQLALLQLAKIEADSVGVGTEANGEAENREI